MIGLQKALRARLTALDDAESGSGALEIGYRKKVRWALTRECDVRLVMRSSDAGLPSTHSGVCVCARVGGAMRRSGRRAAGVQDGETDMRMRIFAPKKRQMTAPGLRPPSFRGFHAHWYSYTPCTAAPGLAECNPLGEVGQPRRAWRGGETSMRLHTHGWGRGWAAGQNGPPPHCRPWEGGSPLGVFVYLTSTHRLLL